MTDATHDTEVGEGPVVRDKRRIDPQTGALREPLSAPASAAAGAPAPDGAAPVAAGTGPAAAAPGPAAGAEGAAGAAGDDADAGFQAQLSERTADLQRVTAEYANYRRRAGRDRDAAREATLANVLTSLLPVLDALERARDHGELEGGFRAVADALEATVAKLGLERYGSEGEPFDPVVHEALMHEHSPDVTETTCVRILQPGYRIGERILRPARVAVADPDA